MKPTAALKSVGLVDALIASFGNALRPNADETAPVALLWTDPEGQWRELIPALRAAIPHLYALGPYDVSKRTGPAIWLKCVVDRTIEEVAPPAGTTPILYVPGVSRQELRAGSECRPPFQPLIELQFRGRVWHQQNGRDWTVEAFAVSQEGLGLDVAQDNRTRDAMVRALPLLAEAPIESLRGHRLEAEDFDKLAVSDPVRDLLRWMSSPEQFRASHDDGRWQSFRNVCRSEFKLDPDDDGPVAAANALAGGGGRWDDVWHRFTEAPRLYPGVSKLLREPAWGQSKLAFDQSRSPIANEEAETSLRRELEAAALLPHHAACERILALEAEHGRRREWVWAQVGESPLAVVLQPLARLATMTKTAVGGGSVEEIALTYASDGWSCDKAALEAMARAGNSERALVAKVVRAVYAPWLDASARHFQDLVSKRGDGIRELVTKVSGEKETCLLFVDGLRFDLGGLLKEKLELRDFRVQIGHRMAALPTVTATAKVVVTPARDLVEGAGTPDDFMPVLSQGKQPAVAPKLRDAIEKAGVEFIDSEELRIPTGSDVGGWTEIGRLDELGHKLGARLALQVDGELDRIADRVSALLDCGWRRVRIVTDHGWLLLPGGLPRFELPSYLVATKWARCALVRGESTPNVPTYSWYWNPHARIASPPGIACFNAGNEYAHGGVSPQECVVPELLVERAGAGVSASITDIQWRGMRCRVNVKTNEPAKVRVDLRINWKKADTSIVASAKELGPSGETNMVVRDDRHEGSSAIVVALDTAGNVLDRKVTTVGEL